MAVMPTMMEIHFWPGRDRRGQYRSWKCKPENPFILRGTYGLGISSQTARGTDICTVLPVRNHSEDMAKLGGGHEKDGIQSTDSR